MKKTELNKEKTCKNCGQSYTIEGRIRIYGDNVLMTGYCSAACYTESRMKVTAPAPIGEGVEGLPEKLDVHSTGLFPMKAEIHPVNDPDGLIVLADVQTMELANELVNRYNQHPTLYRENEELREALAGWEELLLNGDPGELSEYWFNTCRPLLNRINK